MTVGSGGYSKREQAGGEKPAERIGTKYTSGVSAMPREPSVTMAEAWFSMRIKVVPRALRPYREMRSFIL